MFTAYTMFVDRLIGKLAHQPINYQNRVRNLLISLDTYFGWDIVFVIWGRPKTALQQHCEKHQHSVERKSLTENTKVEVFVEKRVRRRAHTAGANLHRGTTKKRKIPRTLFFP